MFIQYPMAYMDIFLKVWKPKNTNYIISWTQTEKLNAIRPKYMSETNLAVHWFPAGFGA